MKFGITMIALFPMCAQAEVALTDVLKTGISQYEAKQICENQGSRLPTVRELAVYASRLGAEGIHEVDPDGVSETRKRNYDLLWDYSVIDGTDVAGNQDQFLYRFKGYVTAIAPGNFSFWSSSDETGDDAGAFVLYDQTGQFLRYRRHGISPRFAVRCVIAK